MSAMESEEPEELLHLPGKPAGVEAIPGILTSLRTPSPAGRAGRGRTDQTTGDISFACNESQSSSDEPAPRPKPKLDADGDPLPQDAVARLGTLRLRHAGILTGAAYSNDGKMLLSTGLDGTVRLWDAATGKQLHRFDVPDNVFPWSAVLSPNSKLLAVASGIFVQEITVRVLEISTGREVFKKSFKRGDNIPLHCVAFAPDGKHIALALDTLTLFDIATGEVVRKFEKEEVRAHGAFFSPDGKSLITRYDGKDGSSIQWWDTAKGTSLLEINRTKEQGPVFGAALAVAPDGKSIVTGEQDGTIISWDAATGKEIRSFKAHAQQVNSLGYSGDGKFLASGSFDFTVGLWDPATGNELGRIKNGENFGLLAVSPDGKTIAAGGLYSSGIITLRDASSGNDRLDLAGHMHPVQSLVFSGDGRTIHTSCRDNVVFAWDAKSGQLKKKLELAKDQHLVAEAREGKALATWSGKGIVRIWDSAGGKQLHELGGHNEGAIFGAVFSPDGKVLAVADPARDGSPQAIFHLWDVTRGKEIRQLAGEIGHVRSLAITPDGNALVSAGEALVLWDLGSGKMLWHTTEWNTSAERDSVEALAISPDGHLLAVAESRHGSVSLFEAASGKKIGSLKTPPPVVKEGQPPRRVWGAGGEGTRIAFAPDGRTLFLWSRQANPSEGIIGLWDLATRKQFDELQTNADAIYQFALSPDGKWLASSTNDTSVLVWDLEKHRPPALLAGNLSADELKRHWDRLAGPDAGAAQDALWSMLADPDKSVAFLKERLEPARVQAVDARKIAKLLAELDDDRFAVRERASTELEKLGEHAGDLLRAALKDTDSVEVRERVEAVLDKLAPIQQSGDRLRALRAVHLLQRLATPEARQQLEKLAKGAPEARLTQEAQAALKWLAERGVNK